MPAPSYSKGIAKTKGKKRAAADDDEGDDLDWAFEEKPSISSSKKSKRNRDLFDTNRLDLWQLCCYARVECHAWFEHLRHDRSISNKDKASVKQLQCEMSRDRLMKDLNRQKNRARGPWPIASSNLGLPSGQTWPKGWEGVRNSLVFMVLIFFYYMIRLTAELTAYSFIF